MFYEVALMDTLAFYKALFLNSPEIFQLFKTTLFTIKFAIYKLARHFNYQS
jgi:hypothetical protein